MVPSLETFFLTYNAWVPLGLSASLVGLGAVLGSMIRGALDRRRRSLLVTRINAYGLGGK